MLERVDHMPQGPIRTEVTFELCRRLGLLFRDHLEDPALGLDAFEDAVHAKPTDLPMVLVTAELARSLGKHDRAALHLAEAASLDPGGSPPSTISSRPSRSCGAPTRRSRPRA